jgi:hypothetical protein
VGCGDHHGYTLGVLMYGFVLVFAPRATPLEVELALTTFVPMAGAGLAQWLALRQHVAGAGRWAFAYMATFLVGWIVMWLRLTQSASSTACSMRSYDAPGISLRWM